MTVIGERGSSILRMLKYKTLENLEVRKKLMPQFQKRLKSMSIFPACTKTIEIHYTSICVCDRMVDF